MEEPEKMNYEEAKRVSSLANKMLVVIEIETDYTYQDVMRALDLIRKNYEKKGRDLLNSTSIQEVARFDSVLD